MIHVFDIVQKDLMQLLRDFRTFLFLLIMPIAFTLLFGFAFGAFSAPGDSRIPVGFLDEDDSVPSREMHEMLLGSEVLRLQGGAHQTRESLDALVADEKLAAAVIVPDGYGKAMLAGKAARLVVVGDAGSPAWTTVEAEILSFASRLEGGVRAATLLEGVDAERMPFDYGLERTLDAWEDPPISMQESTSDAVRGASGPRAALAHFAPGMMLQFALSGLLTAAQVIVTERRSRTLQRLLTTAVRRVHIVTGHYLSMFGLIFTQFAVLILFGQFALGIDYLREPAAVLLVAFAAALCIGAFGLLIGMVAKGEEQAAVLAIVSMFVLSGIGGAWVPLEVTGETFRAVGHISPIAWAMDGFENIVARGFGLESAFLPAAVLAAYALVLFGLAAWRLVASEEK